MVEKSNLDESLFEHYNFLVEKGHDIIRLDKFLMLRLANKSRNRIPCQHQGGNVSHRFCIAHVCGPGQGRQIFLVRAPCSGKVLELVQGQAHVQVQGRRNC